MSLCIRVLSLLLLAVLLGGILSPAQAVTVSNNDLPIDAAGKKIDSSVRTVVIPLLVLFAGILITVAIIWGSRNAASQSVRTVIGLLVLGAFVTGTGIATFFPGLITSVTLMPLY